MSQEFRQSLEENWGCGLQEKKKKVDYPERIEGPSTESRQRVASFNRLLEPRILLICNSWEEDKRQEWLVGASSINIKCYGLLLFLSLPLSIVQ